MTVRQMERIKIKMGFECGVFVDRVGLGGGLALLWRSAVDITLLSYSKNHVDVIVESDGNKPHWRFTGF